MQGTWVRSLGGELRFHMLQGDQALALQLESPPKVKVLVVQSCPTLCDPRDCSPPGSSVYGISQTRILEWVAISSSKGSSWLRDWTRVSCIASRFTTEPPEKPICSNKRFHMMQWRPCMLRLKSPQAKNNNGNKNQKIWHYWVSIHVGPFRNGMCCPGD